MPLDPAVWTVELIKTRWDSAVQALQAQGETIPSPVPKPVFKAASDHGAAAVRINNNTLVKVFQAGDETTRPGSWGYTDVDKDSDWMVMVSTDGPGAREQAWAIRQTIEKILELYRVDPGGDWDLVDGWRARVNEDWPQSQQHTVQFHLSRRGRILQTAVNDPNQ